MRKDEGRTAENGKGSSQEMRGEQSERLEGGGESWNSRVAAKQNKGSGGGEKGGRERNNERKESKREGNGGESMWGR